MPNISDDDIQNVFQVLYPAVGISGKNKLLRMLIYDAIQLAREDDPLDDESVVAQSSPATDCILKFAELWDAQDRFEFEIRDEDAGPIPAEINERPRRGESPESVPLNLWIRVKGSYACFFPKCIESEIDIWLTVTDGKYKAKLRHIKANDYLQIYPALKTLEDQDDRLARVLLDAGYKPTERISLFVVGNSIRVGSAD